MNLSLILKYKFFLISSICFVIPYIEFINFNFTSIDSFVVKTLFYTIIFFILISFVISSILKIFFNKKFSEVFYLCSLIIFFSFNYDKLKVVSTHLLKNTSYHFMGELSIMLIFLISVAMIVFFNKIKKSWFINFLNTYIIFFFILNLFNFFSLQKEQKKNKIENPKIFSDLKYFTKDQVKEILSNKNNKNIYYIIMDGAASLNVYNDHIKKINLEKIISDFKEDNFTYIHNVDSSYDSTAWTLSQIINLSYFKDKNNLQNFIIKEKYPEIFRYFSESPLGKTLDEINYNFYWLGHSRLGCSDYNASLCLPNKKRIVTLKKLLSLNKANLINQNYVLSNFLQKTPYIDFNNKFFFLGKSARESALSANDALNNYMKFSPKLKKEKKKHFTYIHAELPRLFYLPVYNPLTYNKDCSMLLHSKEEIKELKRKSITLSTPEWRTYEFTKPLYEKNYQCMLKRIKEFTKFINQFDPDAMIVIQSDHGTHDAPKLLDDQGEYLNKIFTLVKISNECEDNLSNKIDNINAIRLLLSCATNQKFKSLEK